MHEIPDTIFKPGLIVNQEFFDYPAMQESAKNWNYISKYRFGKGSFYGRHDGIQLNNLQFGHAERHEGAMAEGVSPKDCITISILQKNAGSVCVNGMKMQQGDIIIIDDLKPYDFSSSDKTIFAIISIYKSLIQSVIPHILSATDRLFHDKENFLLETIEDEWKRVRETPEVFDLSDEINKTESKIINAIKYSLSDQTGTVVHLTEGEKTALEVRKFLLDSLEETMTIQNIAEQFNISDKTLQNSSKSLFGFTPKHFMVLLKLNRAHEDLQSSDIQTTNVSDIATKWGFSHFGRFAKEYRSLFGVLPSETLNQTLKTL
jgi:AraC family ethanolamine operon transcriptional activator